MDLNEAPNLSLEIISEIIDDKSTDNEGFIIDDDNKAEWAIRKVSEEKADAQRYINVCRSMIIEYEEKIRKVEEKLRNKTSFLEDQLQKYFDTVSHKVTKTQEIYKLPSGTLKLKYQQPEYKRNEEILVKWLKENNMDSYIKVEEKPNWAELKKNINIVGDKLVTEDGQIIEGVEVLEKTPCIRSRNIGIYTKNFLEKRLFMVFRMLLILNIALCFSKRVMSTKNVK